MMNDYVINAGNDKENLEPIDTAHTIEEGKEKVKNYSEYRYIDIVYSPVDGDGADDYIVYSNFERGEGMNNNEKAIEHANKVGDMISKTWGVDRSAVVWKGGETYIVLFNGMEVTVTESGIKGMREEDEKSRLRDAWFEKIKKIVMANGVHYDKEENREYSDEDLEHMTRDISDEIVSVLSGIIERIGEMEQEAKDATSDIDEDDFDDLDDAATWNYYDGLTAACNRIRCSLGIAKPVKKEIKCRAGYYEWTVSQDGVDIYTFGDPVDDISDEDGDVSEEKIEDFANDIYDVMKEETDEEVDRDDFIRVVKCALCKQYL